MANGGSMQAPAHAEIFCGLIGAHIQVALPESLSGPARALLESLESGSTPGPGSEPACVRVSAGPNGWSIESDACRACAASEEEALLRLQEVMLEAAAARRGDRLLFRGSMVTRGAQTLMIAGDPGQAHVRLALALTTLGFRLVSIGAAAFDTRLVPLPLSLAFALTPEDGEALEPLTRSFNEHLERVGHRHLRPRQVATAPEPTHILFVEAHPGRLSLVRPVAAAAARTRLCGALIAAPPNQSPFSAVAAILRHTRGIHLHLGDLQHALEQLSRLLPHWSIG